MWIYPYCYSIKALIMHLYKLYKFVTEKVHGRTMYPILSYRVTVISVSINNSCGPSVIMYFNIFLYTRCGFNYVSTFYYLCHRYIDVITSRRLELAKPLDPQ